MKTKKMIWVVLVVFLILLGTTPATAAYLSNVSMSVMLPGWYSNQAIILDNNSIVYFTMSGSTPVSNLSVVIRNGSTAVFTNVLIDNSSAATVPYAVRFDDGSGTIELHGTNSFTSGAGNSGISVIDGATMTITGDGVLIANGGTNGAGIGAESGAATGTINMTDQTVIATGGAGGDGINGTANIYGTSDVKAVAGAGGAGLTGDVSVYDTSKVYAGTASAADNDISNTVTLYDTSILFLRYDTGVTPLTPDGHTHRIPTSTYDPLIFSGDAVYGVDVDSSWTDAQGVWYLFETPIPDTGFNMTYLYWSVLAAVVLLSAIVLFLKRKRLRNSRSKA